MGGSGWATGRRGSSSTSLHLRRASSWPEATETAGRRRLSARTWPRRRPLERAGTVHKRLRRPGPHPGRLDGNRALRWRAIPRRAKCRKRSGGAGGANTRVPWVTYCGACPFLSLFCNDCHAGCLGLKTWVGAEEWDEHSANLRGQEVAEQLLVHVTSSAHRKPGLVQYTSSTAPWMTRGDTRRRAVARVRRELGQHEGPSRISVVPDHVGTP